MMLASNTIKVLLADDHKLFRDGLKAILIKNPKIEVVGESSNGEGVIGFLDKKTVDIIILDIEMPGFDGTKTAKLIKTNYINTKILILSMHNLREIIVPLLEIGIDGYVLKNRSKEELLQAILTIYQGNSYFSQDILNTISTISHRSDDNINLTQREVEVLKLIAKGFTSKEIAAELFIGSSTVNTHKRNLLQKLNVSNDKHLVVYAIKKGYVEI